MSGRGCVSKKVLSRQEALEAYQFAIDLLKHLFSDDNVGYYAFDLSYHYRQTALLYAELTNEAKTLDSLKESCHYAVKEATLQDIKFSAPMVNRVHHRMEDTTKNYTGNSCNLSLQTLEDKRFDFVRETEDFRKMVDELKRYAE